MDVNSECREGQRLCKRSCCNSFSTLFCSIIFCKKDKDKDAHLKAEESTDVMDIFIPAEAGTWNIDVASCTKFDLFLRSFLHHSLSCIPMYSEQARWAIRTFPVVSNPADNLQGVLVPIALITIITERCFLTKGWRLEGLLRLPYVTG